VHNYERTSDFLKQDSLAAQSAVRSTCVFGGKIISMGLWPPCLPELNPLVLVGLIKRQSV